LADNPQETVRELRELVVAYAKQETVEPLKGLGRYAGWGIAGALLMCVGIAFLAIGGLRALQTQTGSTFHGNWSWAPYAIVVVGSIIIAGLVWMARGKRKTKKAASGRSTE
jgi:cytochrome b subunit of formate dehydrogenase